MKRLTHKIVSSLLALMVLFAPLEFTVAHNADATEPMLEQMHEHTSTSHSQHHTTDMDDANMQQCESNGGCSDCVYCSPAMVHALQIEIDKPSINLMPLLVSSYSIDLPLEIRPPKQS